MNDTKTTPATEPKPRGAAASRTTPEKPCPSRTMANDRVLMMPADAPPYWEDEGPGSVADPAEIAALDVLDLGTKKAFDFKGMKPINKPILFWNPEVENTADPRRTKDPNPIRGLVLGVFMRPASMNKPADPAKPEEPRTRRAAWILTTAPTWVRDRERQIVKAPANTIVWLDLNQAIEASVCAFAPETDKTTGAIISLTEIAVDPLYKATYTPKGSSETRQAWRMNVYSMRIFHMQQIAALRAFLSPPPIPLDDEDADLPAALPASTETATNAPALPAPAASATPPTAAN